MTDKLEIEIDVNENILNFINENLFERVQVDYLKLSDNDTKLNLWLSIIDDDGDKVS